MAKIYQPSQEILHKYAQVLVRYALNQGKGIQPDEVVSLAVPDVAKELAREIRNEILRAGGHTILRLLPTDLQADFFTLATEEQIKFFPETLMRAQVDTIDHLISIIADVDPLELKEVDPQKIMLHERSTNPYREWLFDKEDHGEFSWTAALWGTPAKAKMVGLSQEKYWQEIIQACFLDEADPVAHWQKLQKQQKKIKEILDNMKIIKVHVKGEDADLTIQIGADRVWRAGSGANIPSFEFFTSPHRDFTEGWIRFNQPLYRYGNVMKNIALSFKNGKVVKATAKTGQDVLQSMIASPQANMLGEFSMTDKRMSRISHVMAETLFDENIGGPFGNTHVAVGMAYKDCYRGNPANVSKEQWEQLGFNDSAVHTDIITTTDRTITATLANGTEIVVYANGKLTFWDGK